MNILKAFIQGIKGVNGNKRYLLLIYLVNFLLVFVLSLSVMQAIQTSLGKSLVAEKLVNSFDGLWYRSFSAQAKGLASTFDPGVVGIGAVLNGLDAFLKGGIIKNYPAVVGVGIVYLLMWAFFAGGLISVYSQQESQNSFLSQAARFFPRLLILAIMAGILYFIIFKFIFIGLTKLVNNLTRETLDERVHFAYTLIKYLLVWLLVWSVNLWFDYGKIITVLRDHKNVFTIPVHAVKTVFSSLGKTYGLYFTIGIVWVILMLLYGLIAPGATQSSWLTIFLAFLVSQVYVLARIWTRCLFYAGQTHMCSALLGK